MSATIHDIKLETIDFDWIKTTTKVSHLKRAIALIQQDGNFYTQLKDACYQRMAELDPSCRKIPPNTPITPQQHQDILTQLNQWEDSVTRKETLPVEPNLQDYQKYFENEGKIVSDKKKKQRAESERLKGNEAIKSKDFDEAISYYTRSLELDPLMYQALGNRALAYLKKKEFGKCLQDCDKALSINPNFSKAYHRKAKVYIEQKNRIQAYRCYKQIIRLQPQNGEVNKQMMELRSEMNEDQIRELESHLLPESEFKKITIEEDSDEEIEQK